MADFFITLVSNSSMNIFPENKTSSFTVLLPEKISLKGTWSVGVAEVHYNYNFFNVTDDNNELTLHTKNVEDVTSSNRITRNEIKSSEMPKHKVSIKKGYYNTVAALIGTVNKSLKPFVNGNDTVFSIDEVTNRTMVHRENLRPEIEKIFLEGRLSMQLGFMPGRDVLMFKSSPHVGNTKFGIPDQMLIYTDIIEPTFIGHEKAYVIKIVNTEPKNYTFGDACYKEYTHIHYMAIQKREFESISVDIRDYTGEFMPFQHGVLMIKLHFKRENV